METQEGNKLIAEFMGYKFDPNKKDGSPFYKELKEESWESKSYANPKYHSSWDWLMPVVEKIYSLGFFYYNIADMNCEIGSEPLIDVTSKLSTIDAVWQAVIQFIQWYNQQPSPSAGEEVAQE